MARVRRLLPGIAILVAGLVLAVGVWHAPLLRAVGTWLRVEDRLERADAIVVLAGGTPRREATAAALWEGGLGAPGHHLATARAPRPSRADRARNPPVRPARGVAEGARDLRRPP